MARKTTQPTQTPKRGRPPLYGEAMAGRTRQALHKQRLQADLADVAFALRLVLRHSDDDTKAGFRANYRGTGGERLRRGLCACLKGHSESNAEVLVFFDTLLGISSDDTNNGEGGNESLPPLRRGLRTDRP
jgi:hypothetical protein